MDRQPERTWAEIDLEALRHNAHVARQRVGPGVALLAVIKANAYGHGLAQIAKALASEAELFGVANLGEALETQRAIADRPVLILGPAFPAERPEIVAHGFIASVSSAEEAAAFAAEARQKTVQLNLVIDTGMGRMGCAEDAAVETVRKIMALRAVTLHSISTHLPVADEDEPFTRQELTRFESLVEAVRASAPGGYKVHALLSAGVLGFNETPFDIVRAGLMLYGISPLPRRQDLLRPVLSLKSRVVLLRDLPAGATISYGRTFTTPRAMRVATIGVGYADGYPRALSNRGAVVLIRGRRCAVLGRVTMDLIVVDVSHVGGVKPGDEAVLIGRQGDNEILASEIAERASTIPWEIFTGIGTRVRRVYL
ncbi:MAG: alanine racemase [Chthoniobacterales bacterium]